MKTLTLCFPIKDKQVLLGMKKRGFGAGFWNGFGGKLLDDETVHKATIRELHEETGIHTHEKDLEKVGVIHFYFNDKKEFECIVFFVKKWKGKEKETEEMKPKWFPVEGLPLREMWEGDKLWMKDLISGQRMHAKVYYNNFDEKKVVKFKCRKWES